MTARDPRIDPLPGDVFRLGNGRVLRILDRFISTGSKPGSGNPGYFVEEPTSDGGVCTGTSSRGVFRNKVRKADVVQRSSQSDTGWEAVERHPHSEVTAIMRRKHNSRA